MEQFNLIVGEGYSKEELEGIFHTNFGSRIKGITLRRDNQDSPYTLIFSRVHGPYTDRWVGADFYYDGEGEGRDQTLTTANKALVEANNNGRIILGFRQEEPSGPWNFLGILNVVDYSYVPKNGFMTYEFRFRVSPLGPKELVEAEEDIQKDSNIEPKLTQPGRKESKATRRARDAAFSRDIRKLYKNRCAVCGKERYSAAGYPEVVGAHIYPVEKDGPDDLRNGLALCSLHHWAFDAGLIALTDSLSVIVKDSIKGKDTYKEITDYAGNKIYLPEPNQYHPHRIFVSAHREIHNL